VADPGEGAEAGVLPLQQHHRPLPQDEGRLYPRRRPHALHHPAAVQTHGGKLRGGGPLTRYSLLKTIVYKWLLYLEKTGSYISCNE